MVFTENEGCLKGMEDEMEEIPYSDQRHEYNMEGRSHRKGVATYFMIRI